MSLESVSFQASGNVSPSRFVSGVSGSDYRVFQATASTPVVGVSQIGTQEAPGTDADSGYAATTTKALRVYGMGEVALLELGGTVSAFDYVAPDASGKGTAASLNVSSIQYVGGQALRSGISGEKIPVVVGAKPPTATN
jgi:hypothetical protein